MASARKIDLLVNQKASFSVNFNISHQDGTPLDLTDYTSSAKFKADYSSSDNTAISFDTTISDAANGVITMSLTPDQTSGLVENQKYVYDLSITNNTTSFKSRIVQGFMKISAGVS